MTRLDSGLHPLLQSGVQFQATRAKMLSRCENQLIAAQLKHVHNINSFEHQGKLLTHIGRCWVFDHQNRTRHVKTNRRLMEQVKAQTVELITCYCAPHLTSMFLQGVHGLCVPRRQAGATKSQDFGNGPRLEEKKARAGILSVTWFQ